MSDRATAPTTEPATGQRAALGEPEPWAGWETRLCLWSLALGLIALGALALLLETLLR